MSRSRKGKRLPVPAPDEKYTLTQLRNPVIDGVERLPPDSISTSCLAVHVLDAFEKLPKSFILPAIGESFDILEQECSGTQISEDTEIR